MDNTQDNELIPVDDVRRTIAWWPYSSHATYRLIRAGRLGAVAVGKRRFLTRALLRAFVERHTSGHTA